MGYLITAHVFRGEPNLAQIAELPKSIGYRLYQHRAENLYLLDAFRAAKAPPFPFQTLLPSADIPLELPPGLETLERVYSQLGHLNLANGFKRSYINAALLLNRLLQVPVFSFASNDDELDYTCSAADGALSRLKCRCNDLVILYENDKVQITPLVPEADENEVCLTNLDAMKSALFDVEVLPRATPWSTQLHCIALDELKTFAGITGNILGLGSFDPPEDEFDLQLVASR